MIITTMAKPAADSPLTSCSMELRIVSSVWVLVMIAETPPASETTSAGPIMSAAPAPIRRTISASFIRAISPTMIDAKMNSIASCGNHQLSSHANGSAAVSCST